MKFTDEDIKRITDILFNVYSLAKKKKLSNVPNTFKKFLIKHINDNLCPRNCLDYASLYV